jgi:hypothetical protein
MRHRAGRGLSHRLLPEIVLVGLGLFALAASPHRPGAQAPHTPAGADFPTALHVAMRTMIQAMEATPMSGDPDRDFLAMMIPHHEGAIEMARLALLHGRDPLVRQLAEGIIAGQQAEVIAMRGRLARLRAGQDGDPEGFPALGGTRGPARVAPSR